MSVSLSTSVCMLIDISLCGSGEYAFFISLFVSQERVYSLFLSPCVSGEKYVRYHSLSVCQKSVSQSQGQSSFVSISMCVMGDRSETLTALTCSIMEL